jgi:hypothetical protein
MADKTPDPSLEQIAAATAAIRSTWTENEFLRRSTFVYGSSTVVAEIYERRADQLDAEIETCWPTTNPYDRCGQFKPR